MEISLRRPTPRMIEKLKECFKKQVLSGEKIPCLPEEMKSSLAGLYKRGLIYTRMEMVDNKQVLCIYVTESGKNLLSKLEKKSKEPGKLPAPGDKK